MIYSMTGFGKKEFSLFDKNYVIEIKTLNGKNFEVVSKIHSSLKGIESTVKNLLQQKLLRGSIEILIYLNNSNTLNSQLNINTAKEYYNILNNLCDELQIPKTNFLELIIKNQEITNGININILNENDIQKITQKIDECVLEIFEFRKREGEIICNDMKYRLNLILEYKQKIIELSPERIELIKKSLNNKLELLNNENLNKDRFEQELIYYFEKIDFTEEIIRFDAHCEYFKVILNEINKEITKGKKLGFIVQEIGREVNTIGSKAQNANIQKYVIMIKDELEKIKEQVNNIL